MARKSGRPVKMVMTREEVMRASGRPRVRPSTVKIGAKKDGTIVAARHLVSAGGRAPRLADPGRGGLRLRAV